MFKPENERGAANFALVAVITLIAVATVGAGFGQKMIVEQKIQKLLKQQTAEITI